MQQDQLPEHEQFELGKFFSTNSFDTKPPLGSLLGGRAASRSSSRRGSRASQRAPPRPFTSNTSQFVDLLGSARKDKARAPIVSSGWRCDCGSCSLSDCVTGSLSGCGSCSSLLLGYALLSLVLWAIGPIIACLAGAL